MTLFAVSDSVWLAIVGIVAMAVKEFFDRSRLKEAARTATEERNIVAARQSANLNAVAQTVAVVAKKVEEVHVATNGLTKALGEAKLAQGTAEGTALGLQQGRDEAKHLPAETSIVRDPAGQTIATIEPAVEPPAATRRPSLFTPDGTIQKPMGRG